jgi:uncharacterized protein YjbJ (UPF0337 family)
MLAAITHAPTQSRHLRSHSNVPRSARKSAAHLLLALSIWIHRRRCSAAGVPAYVFCCAGVCWRQLSRNVWNGALARGVIPAWQTEAKKTMDWNRIEGNWKQAKGSVKEKWGQLTDDDLAQVNGQRDQLEGKIQQRYGLAKDMVRKDVDDWLKSQP